MNGWSCYFAILNSFNGGEYIIFFLFFKLNKVWFTWSQSRSTGYVRDSSIQRHGCKKTHKIIFHHHRCVPDNGASLNPRECWTMLLECHSDLTYVGPISVHQNACNMWSDTVLLNSDDVFELNEITCCCMISSRYSTSFIYFPLTVTRDVCSFMSSNPITHHHAASIKLYARQ